MAPLTFRNSKIIYYGPHACENCGAMIVKMGAEWGGTAFTNPDGPIYPNTEWHPHVCDPKLVRSRKSMSAASRVLEDFPLAEAVLVNQLGFVILGEEPRPDSGTLSISANQTFADSEEGAWLSALERLQNKWPTWHIELDKYGIHRKYVASSDPLMSLPQG